MRAEFVDEPFKIEIKDGFALVSWSDGFALTMPVRVCRENVARTIAALAEYDRGKVVPFPKPRRPRSKPTESGD